MLELAVLGLLKDQPLHGYELKKRLGETLGFLWGVSYGSLYPALRRLERAGAIAIVAAEAAPPPSSPPTGSITGDLAAARLRAVAGRLSASSRRTRKAYQITAAGETLFTQLLSDDTHGDDEKAFALKLVFCRHLAPAQRLELLLRRRAALAERLERQLRAGGNREDRYTRSLVEHRTKSTQRDLEWVDELITAERAAAGEDPSAVREPVKEEASA